METERKYRRSGQLLLVAFLVTGAAQLASQLISGRLLGPSSYSVVATVVSLMSLAGIPLVGLQLTTSAHVTAGGAYRPLLHKAVRYGATAGLLFALLSPLTSKALNIPLGVTLVSGSLFIPITFTLAVLRGAVTGQGRSTLLAVAMLCAALLRVVATWVGTLQFGVAGSIAAPILAEAAVAAVLYRYLHDTVDGSSVKLPATRRMLIASVATTAGWLIANVDLLWARQLLSEANAGVYLAAASSALGLVSLGQATLWHRASRVLDRRSALSALSVSVATVSVAALIFTPIGAAVLPWLLGAGFEELPGALVATAVSSVAAATLVTAVSVLLLCNGRLHRDAIGAVVFAVLAPPVAVHLLGAEPWVLAGAATASAVLGSAAVLRHLPQTTSNAPSDPVIAQ